MQPPSDWFSKARFGLFVHYGLYSLLERGEWVMNRERIAPREYAKLAARFTAERFDANALCDLAVRSGMRYINFTTMHHDGFRLYDTQLSDFNSVNSAAKRDLTGEVVAAARARNLPVALYHSLNNWSDQPDASAALEDKSAYETFIINTHKRLRELVVRYKPDVLWYDGWWPFNAEGWRGEAMNRMAREIQPRIMFNGRNGLPGDFSTPEGHASPPKPWRPWEACMTLNHNWGFHRGDHDWKTPGQVVDLLAAVAAGNGNLLLNIGPHGDGSIPEESVRVHTIVGDWLKRYGECIYDTDVFVYDLRERGANRGDWSHYGPFTTRGNNLYLLARRWPGESATIAGLECRVQKAVLLGSNSELKFTQNDGVVKLESLPAQPPDPVCPVIRFECDRAPSMNLGAGMRIPNAKHPTYDPCPSDLIH